METDETIGAAAERLRAEIRGDVVLPSEEGWDEARAAWNLAVDQRPAVVVVPESAEDIAAAVSFAVEIGAKVVAQGTGHNAFPLGDLSDAVMIKTSRMRGVEIDPDAGTARVEAGAQWGDVVPAAAGHGLISLAGSSHDVGVVGYSLGGGVSWLARSKGMACDSVTAIELITADGVQRRVDADNDPDLFWALRGGGGDFGIVTAMEFGLFEAGDIYAGALFFPPERAPEVLEAWRVWTETVPDEVTSIGRTLNFPPFPEIPEPLRGNSFAIVEAVFLGDAEAGAELIAPLRDLGPVMDTFAAVGPADLLGLHMDPPGPVPGKGDHQMLRELTPEALQAALAVTSSDAGKALLGFEIRHLGGALARSGASCIGTLGGDYMTFGVGIVMGPDSVPALREALANLREAFAPVDSGRPYLNFAELPVTGESIYEPAAFTRLVEVLERVDPYDIFRANHPLARVV